MEMLNRLERDPCQQMYLYIQWERSVFNKHIPNVGKNFYNR